MQNRYGYFRRANGVFYSVDLQNKRQTSLQTRFEAEAKRLTAAKNQAADTPQLNRAMAKVYASAASPELMTRTWAEVMTAYATKSAKGSRERVERSMRSQPFALLRTLRVNETDASVFFAVLNHKRAGNSTNHYLRRVQNFAFAMRWLFEPVIPGPEWPKIKKKHTVAISAEEHAKIIVSELNPEHQLYYEMLWETGGSQSDIASLTWERINVRDKLISFYRDKLDEREEGGELCGLSVLAIGPRLEEILGKCPQGGYLFPTLSQWTAGHRTTEFARRCRIAGVKNRQMKGYRFGWAERARFRAKEEEMNHEATDKAQCEPWQRYFDGVIKILSAEKDKAIANFTKAYGPRTSIIQARLRSVYGFEDVEMQTSNGKIVVTVRRNGEELRPIDYFSQSQIQTLLLGLFLAASTSQTWSGFCPILLDDPVTHFDDLNVYSFLDLIAGLLGPEGGGRQFIISTCDQKLMKLARQKFRNEDGSIVFYRFSDIGRAGPAVEKMTFG